MVYATRGNRMIQIEEYSIPKYVAQGYNIINGNGGVLQNAVPTDINVLKKSYSEHIKEIKALKAKNAELESIIAELKAAKAVSKAKVEKPSTPVVEESKSDEMTAEDIVKAEESLNRPRKSRASKSNVEK